MPLPEDVHADALVPGLATVVLRGLDRGAVDDGRVLTATGVDRAEPARLAGRTPRIDPPATGSGDSRPTIPS